LDILIHFLPLSLPETRFGFVSQEVKRSTNGDGDREKRVREKMRDRKKCKCEKDFLKNFSP
jgi:hypothetical protein